jgi:hypothetical protein
MKVNLIKTKDFYSTMKDWCEGHNFPHISPSMLPDTTFICYNDKGEQAYSICFYNTDSGIAWIGWELSNPKLSKEDKEGCFDYLIEKVEEYSKLSGYHIVFTTSNTPPVEDLLKGRNYSTGDVNVNHYLKFI